MQFKLAKCSFNWQNATENGKLIDSKTKCEQKLEIASLKWQNATLNGKTPAKTAKHEPNWNINDLKSRASCNQRLTD